jgi:diketogulonate reductase-like aldo/keto reductase
MENFQLNNGKMIPAVGIGTFLLTGKEAENSVLHAIQDGYKLIDTANAYRNEVGVGRGIKASHARREDLFVSTKLWPNSYTFAEEAFEATLKRLDMEYVDLLFLHQPVGDYLTAYKAMEKEVARGRVRALGLSNFSAEQIQELVQKTSIKPAVVQVEAHPYYPQGELKKVLNQYGTYIMAWYPLGHGDSTLLNEPVFKELAAKYGKSTAQIILRWHTQIGNIVIPGSKNPDHIKDNIDIFDFALTDEEMHKIAALDKNEAYYHQTDELLQKYLNQPYNFDDQK